MHVCTVVIVNVSIHLRFVALYSLVSLDMAGLRFPSSRSFGGECWKVAEMATRDVLFKIWPALVADKKRNEIIEYLQSLVKYHTSCEVFCYGSVPLKTYFSDGDIDLTVINLDIPDAVLASDVCSLLLRESRNVASRFTVTDVQYIDAEVKLVKCIVEDIVVDISTNQLGGLSALCFLEQIDRSIGEDHLFKRSIILIKAWCYYESRILGSHHGLISTYALEILVLHIFDLFHNSLEGPLSVLYKFLIYFSAFDWDNYCISLKGLVGKYSRRDVVDDIPRNDRLLSEEFLNSCCEKFGVPSRIIKGKLEPFRLKYLNIIDPLKENNNLGRSVSKGSFCRIRSAFKYGADKLSRILSLPAERITNELHAFFSNSLRMNKINYQNIAPRIVDTPKEYGPVLLGIDTPAMKYISSESYNEAVADYSTMLSDMMFRFTNLNQQEKQKHPVSEEVAHSGVNPITMAFVDTHHVSKVMVENLENHITPGAEAVRLLLDLHGDYERHFRNLRYGQLCHVYATAPTWHPVFLPPQQQCNNVPWKPPCPPFSAGVDPQTRCQNSYYGSRSRGTGTYVPNMNYHPQSYRRAHGRRREMELRSFGQFQIPRQFCGESWNMVPEEFYAPPFLEQAPQTEFFSDWSSGSSDNYQPINYSSEIWDSSCSSSLSPNDDINNSPVIPLPELDSGALLSQDKPCAAVSVGRVVDETYRLKDECDFPPLTV